MSLRRDPLGQYLEMHTNEVGIAHTHSTFHYHTYMQYICQIEAYDAWVKDSGFLPHESLSFGPDLKSKVRIAQCRITCVDGENSPTPWCENKWIKCANEPRK